MQSAYRSLSAVALALLSASAFASTVTYSSSASFLANLQPGSYTEGFNGLANPAPASFSGSGFSYNVSSPLDIYASGDFLGTSLPYEELTITFTSGNVTAVGGNFFASLVSDAFAAGVMNIVLSDGTSASFTPTSAAVGSYRGFTSDVAITSLKLTVSNFPLDFLYAGLDNLTVGTAVPEPASWLLAGLGLAGLFVTRRRSA